MGDARGVLLDTGPLVAMLSRHDAGHARCAAALRGLDRLLISSEAVLTEAMHLLRLHPEGPDACLEFFHRGGALLVPLNDERIVRSRQLLRKYADVPMDYADATLVCLAEEFGVGSVFTLDLRGFSVYRWKGNRRFTILPEG